ncbi:MAG: DNA replication and repair protein RecF, partial [Alphaproteobacteria bacterium]|nr:DNA replication and repair protein RecF [Alphaproteobacteria bacterium]
PHRTDLVVTHRDKAVPAREASTGEQKALLIAIILTNAALEGPKARARPVMLLDEVAAHLDAARRAALCEALLALGVQAWLTGTDPHLFEALAGRAQLFRVETGSVHRLAA